VAQQIKGIVIHSLSHSDGLLIVRIFTESHGLRAFLVRRPRSSGRSGTHLFQPLNVLEFVSEMSENRQVFPLRSPAILKPHPSLFGDPVKATVALFMSELLHRTLEEGYANGLLFSFVSQAADLLDKEDSIRNFPIWFTLSLCREYGFDPSQDVPTQVSPHFEHVAALGLLTGSYSEVREVSLDPTSKTRILSDCVHYLMTHLGRTHKINSLAIMHEVLRG